MAVLLTFPALQRAEAVTPERVADMFAALVTGIASDPRRNAERYAILARHLAAAAHEILATYD